MVAAEAVDFLHHLDAAHDVAPEPRRQLAVEFVHPVDFRESIWLGRLPVVLGELLGGLAGFGGGRGFFLLVQVVFVAVEFVFEQLHDGQVCEQLEAVDGRLDFVLEVEGGLFGDDLGRVAGVREAGSGELFESELRFLFELFRQNYTAGGFVPERVVDWLVVGELEAELRLPVEFADWSAGTTIEVVAGLQRDREVRLEFERLH